MQSSTLTMQHRQHRPRVSHEPDHQWHQRETRYQHCNPDRLGRDQHRRIKTERESVLEIFTQGGICVLVCISVSILPIALLRDCTQTSSTSWDATLLRLSSSSEFRLLSSLCNSALFDLISWSYFVKTTTTGADSVNTNPSCVRVRHRTGVVVVKNAL